MRGGSGGGGSTLDEAELEGALLDCDSLGASSLEGAALGVASLAGEADSPMLADELVASAAGRSSGIGTAASGAGRSRGSGTSALVCASAAVLSATNRTVRG